MKVNVKYATQSLDKDGLFLFCLIRDCSRNFSGSRECEPSSSYLSGRVGGEGGGRQGKDIIMTTRVSSEYLKSQSQLKQLLEE